MVGALLRAARFGGCRGEPRPWPYRHRQAAGDVVSWLDVAVGTGLVVAFVSTHTVCITLPFYRRTCPVCGGTGWSRCDRATHDATTAEQVHQAVERTDAWT